MSITALMRTESSSQRRLLIDRCDGLFIFAFAACQLLEDSNGGEKPLKDIFHEFTDLDGLYYKTLANADTRPQCTREALKSILSVVVAAHEPLSVAVIAALLPTRVKATDVQVVVSKLGSILGSGGWMSRYISFTRLLQNFFSGRVGSPQRLI